MKLPALRILIVALFLFSGLSLVTAQETERVLVYDVPAEGEITNSAFSQTWEMDTTSPDRITIIVERVSGNLIPDIALLDNNNQPISTGGNDQTGAVARIENLTLPSSGTFNVLVQRRDGGSGLTTGRYRVTVQVLGTAPDNPNNQQVISELQLDTPVTGEVTNAYWYHRYTYTAAGTDVLNVEAARLSGNLFPVIDVLDDNGTQVTFGYNDYRTGETARIDRLELPGPGTYTIVVSRDGVGDGQSQGTYELSISLLGMGEDNPALAGTAGTIQYDTDLSGELGAQWYDDWAFSTEAGDTITITADRSSGTLWPQITLLGAAGQEITSGYTQGSNTQAIINRYQLDGPGDYTIRIWRSGGRDGWTSGGYSLRVDLNGAGAGSPNLADPSGTIAIGDTVNEIINGERWVDGWTFEGRAGQPFTIEINRTSGTLIPRLRILDSTGTNVLEGWYDPAWTTVLQEGITLPADGTYTIQVFRDGEQNGQTSGGYKLSITAAAS